MDLPKRKKKKRCLSPSLLTVKITALLTFALVLKWTQSYRSKNPIRLIFSDFNLA